MSVENCAQPSLATRLYASLRWSLSLSGASGPPTREFLINGRAVRSIASPSTGIDGVLPAVASTCGGSVCGALWTTPHTARKSPPFLTTSRSMDSTIDEDFHPARKFRAGPPSVCRQVSRIERDVDLSYCGQPAPSTRVPC